MPSAKWSCYEEARMTSTDWDEFTRRWRDLWSQQAEQSRNWFENQWRPADLPDGPGGMAASSADTAAAMTELWRSWIALSGSLGRNLPGLTDTAGVAAGTLGRLLDQLPRDLEPFREVKRGRSPRVSDAGPIPLPPLPGRRGPRPK